MSMTFEELKLKAKTGDVISFRGNSLLSTLLKIYTGEAISHIGFVVWLRFGKETADRLCVFHAHPFGGVMVSPLADMLGSGVIWQATKLNGDESVGYALEQWGRRYASMFQFLLMTWPWLKAKWESFGLSAKQDNRFHCSQLVSESLQFAHGELPKSAAEMTPGDVMKLSCLEAPIDIM